LKDTLWQQQHLAFLDQQSARLAKILTDNGLAILGGTNLFQTVTMTDADALHAHLARHLVWTRKFTAWPDLLRFGVPAGDDDFARLEQSLKNWR